MLGDEDMRNIPDDRKHGIALVLAAFPSVADVVLNNKVLAFLRRSQQQMLAEVPLADVRASYIDAVRESGKKTGQDDALAAAEAAAGYPYMVQLVGYCMRQSQSAEGLGSSNAPTWNVAQATRSLPSTMRSWLLSWIGLHRRRGNS